MLSRVLLLLTGCVPVLPLHAAWLDCYDSTGGGDLQNTVDTGAFLGWLEVSKTPWIYSYTLSRYIYIPGDACDPAGTWVYFTKPPDTLDKGMLLYLPLDDGSIRDESGYNRFTLLYQAVAGEGVFTDCYWFDGVDNFIRVVDFDYGPDFSVTFWFNSSENGGTQYQYLFSHGQVHTQNTANYYFVEDNNANNGGQIKTNHFDENDVEASDLLFTETGLSDGTWHHYAVTAGQDGTKLYIDGQFWRAAPDLGGDPINPEGPIYIGSRWDRETDRSYEGYLDDIRMYDRALSAEAVRILHARGR